MFCKELHGHVYISIFFVDSDYNTRQYLLSLNDPKEMDVSLFLQPHASKCLQPPLLLPNGTRVGAPTQSKGTHTDLKYPPPSKYDSHTFPSSKDTTHPLPSSKITMGATRPPPSSKVTMDTIYLLPSSSKITVDPPASSKDDSHPFLSSNVTKDKCYPPLPSKDKSSHTSLPCQHTCTSLHTNASHPTSVLNDITNTLKSNKVTSQKSITDNNTATKREATMKHLHKCLLCGKQYSQKSGLSRHIKLQHPLHASGSLTCNQCSSK